MTKPLDKYTIDADLLQAIVNTLNEQPAKQVRLLLNAIDKVVYDQQVAAEEDDSNKD